MSKCITDKFRQLKQKLLELVLQPFYTKGTKDTQMLQTSNFEITLKYFTYHGFELDEKINRRNWIMVFVGQAAIFVAIVAILYIGSGQRSLWERTLSTC